MSGPLNASLPQPDGVGDNIGGWKRERCQTEAQKVKLIFVVDKSQAKKKKMNCIVGNLIFCELELLGGGGGSCCPKGSGHYVIPAVCL